MQHADTNTALPDVTGRRTNVQNAINTQCTPPPPPPPAAAGAAAAAAAVARNVGILPATSGVLPVAMPQETAAPIARFVALHIQRDPSASTLLQIAHFASAALHSCSFLNSAAA
jgi:hypothetical protein